MKEVALMRSAATIDGIARHGLTKVFQMNSDLVGASRAGTAFDEGLALIRSEHTVVGECLTATLIDGHFLAMDLVATDRDIDFPMGHSRCSIHQCQISFFYAARGEFLRDQSVGLFGLCYNETAGRLLIESMDDSGTLDPADHSDALAMMENGIGYCSLMVPRARMDDQAWRLIDHKKGIVLEKNIKRDVLG